jgi:hypothetical protein
MEDGRNKAAAKWPTAFVALILTTALPWAQPPIAVAHLAQPHYFWSRGGAFNVNVNVNGPFSAVIEEVGEHKGCGLGNYLWNAIYIVSALR